MSAFVQRLRICQFGVLALAVAVTCGTAQAQQSPRATPRSGSVVAGESVVIEGPDDVILNQSGIPGRSSRGFVPRHERRSPQMFGGQLISQQSEGPTVYESVVGEIHPEVIHPHGDVHGGCCGNGDCGHGGCGGGDCHGGSPCHNGCLIGCPKLSIKNMQFWAGAHGAHNPRFLGQPDRAGDGSFGFQEGINWGFYLPCMPRQPIAAQIGLQAVQSNFKGASYTPTNRSQTFLTAGLYRRVDWGLQGGVVFDYLREDWYIQQEITQIRGELSWVYPQGLELGFNFASAMSSDTNIGAVHTGLNNPVAINQSETWEPLDYYAFFVRKQFACGGEGRAFVGFSRESDVIVGSEVLVPISDHFAVQGGFTYLLPEDTTNPVNSIDEVWNVGINLVWMPGGTATVLNRYNRPLFNVADNGSLLISRRSP